MKHGIFITLSFIVIFTFTSCVYEPEKKVSGKSENTVIALKYVQGDITILYPEILGLKDEKTQVAVNDLLKNEAFRDLTDWLYSGEKQEDLKLSIEYEMAYQGKHFLSVKYTGLCNVNGYARKIFSTVNIDLDSGKRLKLSDIVHVNYDFIEVIRDTLTRYAEKENPDWAIVYNDKLDKDDKALLTLFTDADTEHNTDCFSYFTEDYLGIIFSTYRVAGDYFEIELRYENIKEHLSSFAM